jgi:hypothetical protein
MVLFIVYYKQQVTPDQQALIEKLYLDLRLINPELAFATLKASALMESGEAQFDVPSSSRLGSSANLHQRDHPTASSSQASAKVSKSASKNSNVRSKNAY